MKTYITFGSAKYDSTIELIVQNAPRFGVDRVLVYDESWLEAHEFRQLNHWLWDHHHDPSYGQFDKRGFGLYAWKPFVIMEALSRCEYGDFVLYTDADTYPVRDLSPLFSECAKEGIMLFAASAWRRNAMWCKRDCFIVMGQNAMNYEEAPCGVARFAVFQNDHRWRPIQFLMEWLTYAVNPLATTFDPSRLGPEPEGFQEHRTEQAIMTLLAHKYGYKLHREADQHGDHAGSQEDRDLYPQPLFHHVDFGGQNNADGIARPSRFRNV